MEQQPASILLLNDDRERPESLCKILRDHGYTARQASDAAPALAAARANPPDLVLLDTVTCAADSHVVCAEMKADPGLAPIPVIFIGVPGETFDTVRAFAIGAVDYIATPFEVDVVLARVATHIAYRRAQQLLAVQNLRLQEEIARRKQAEEALRFSEARYQDLVAYQPELICRFKRDTTLTFVNDAYCEYFGKAREALLGHSFLDLIPEEDHAGVLEYLAGLTCESPVVFYEHRAMDGAGRIRWQQWTDRAMCDAQGAIVELQSTGRDITERKQAEDALRASEQRYRALVRHFPNGAVFLFDTDLRFLIADGTGLAAAGFSAEQLEGKTLLEALPPELVARLEPYYRAVLAGDAPTRSEREYAGRIYSFDAVALRDEHDAIVAGMLITQDVTEQHRYTEAILGMNLALEARVAERTAALTTSLRALEESQRFSEQLAAASPALLVLYDLCSQQIRYANRNPATILGYEAGHDFQLSSAKLCELTHPDDVLRLSQLASWSALADDEVVEHEVRIRHANGEWNCFMLRGSVFARAADGSVSQLLIAALDVTSRRKIEEEIRAYHSQLVQVQDAERAHIARELHDQVGQILTALNLTLATIADGDPAMMRNRIHDAQAQVRDLTAQVRQLSLNLRPAMLDDLGLLAALLWHAQRFSEQTGIQVDVQHGELAPHPSPEIAMTAYRVSQEALTNVARHAGVERATLQLWTSGQTLYVQVTDAGHGFDVEAMLAQPVSSGLFSMRERVRLVGGTLSIESAQGRGTHVTAELPLWQLEPEPRR